MSAKGEDARRHTAEELRKASGGAPDTEPVLRESPQSAKGEDARRHTAEELRKASGGAPDTEPVLREALKSGAWLEELLPNAMVSARARIWWLLFFALFPLAYAGGVWLAVNEESAARIGGAEDRASSIQTAQKFAEAKGISVHGWHQFVIVETHDDLLAYYGDAKRPDLATARNLAPARVITVLLRSPDQKAEFRAYLSLTGQVTGFDMGRAGSTGDAHIEMDGITLNSTASESSKERAKDNAASQADKATEAIARRALDANPVLTNFLKLKSAASIGTNEDDPQRTDVVWDASPANHKEITFHITVSVRDSQVVGERITAGIDEDYIHSALPKKSRFSETLIGIYSVFLTFSAFYAIYRYAKRTLQKEVSHARTVLVAGLFCLFYSIFVYSIWVDQVATRVGAHRFTSLELPVGISALVSFALMGLLVGIAYGSGEGEVREAYPGKLTSLDALLAGRVFSRDVAASILFGVAAAGWLLFCQHGFGYFLRTDILSARSEGLRYTFARLPWLTLLVGRQYESLLVAVTGLLLPASFLLRTSTAKRRRFFWLILFALLSILPEAARYPSVPSSLLAMAIFASALLTPFFAFDLLAAMVSSYALALVNELARLSAVFPAWIGFALWLAALVAAVVALAVYLALHGRQVREEDVRPQYARNLAERMGMQAEVLAAREAQLRLLPQAAPEIPGIQFAACCLPAKGVGGDFYDFFRLDANRVGIFVAQGGERGLASALCIALAKGVLMHASQQPHSAAQIVIELEARMAELLEGGGEANISFAYGVVDTRRNVLNYARIGVSPRLIVHRQDTGVTSSAQFERAANLPGRPASAPLIHEGAAHLQAGDYLIFFTEGVMSLRARRFGKREYHWLDLLMRELGRPDEPLQKSLVAALAKHHNRASEDLTAVVLRVVQIQALEQEVVA
jgi:serine phosphatase RsbU (regulator of sigma subunit)